MLSLCFNFFKFFKPKIFMKNFSIHIIVLFFSQFLFSCQGPTGPVGPAGSAGAAGAAGEAGATGATGPSGRPAQGNSPAGIAMQVWNSFSIEDRRNNTNPGDIGIGTARLVRDDFSYYFFEFSGFNTSDAADTEYAVYSTVAGAALSTQQGFDASERPILLDTISKGTSTIHVALPSAPTRATGGSQRFYDWIVIYPLTGADTDAPGIVADLDATNLEPRRQVWNSFLLEDRTTADNATYRSGNNGSARIITNADQGRTRYWLNLTDFQNIGQAIARGSGSIVADSFAIFMATAGAGLNTQNGFDEGDQPVYVGTLVSNGAQYIPMLVSAARPDNVTLGANNIVVNTNSGVSLDDNNYMIPQRSTGSRGLWYDWVILHPYEDANLRPITYPGIVADLDRDNELADNQRVAGGE